MVKDSLEERCKKSVIKIADTVEKIRKQLYNIEDINQKLSHIIKNLGEEYYYGRKLRQRHTVYNNGENAKY